MDSAKAKIRSTVAEYIRLNPVEFKAFEDQMKQVRRTLADEKFGTARNVEGFSGMRALYEVPEVLHEMLVNTLEIPELEWLKAGGSDNKQGGQWFAKTFPEFRIPEQV